MVSYPMIFLLVHHVYHSLEVCGGSGYVIAMNGQEYFAGFASDASFVVRILKFPSSRVHTVITMDCSSYDLVGIICMFVTIQWGCFIRQGVGISNVRLNHEEHDIRRDLWYLYFTHIEEQAFTTQKLKRQALWTKKKLPPTFTNTIWTLYFLVIKHGHVTS